MKKLFLLVILISTSVVAQITLKITAVPTNTPAGATIYVAGNFNGWNPSATPMVADGAGNYTYTVAEGSGVLEYKFTRGAWSSVEGTATGDELSNRTATFTGTAQTLNLTVASWKDLGGTANPSTAASNVKILSNDFLIPQLNRTRKIWIYLPPDYETSTKRYPVLYMQDGQNLFDDKTSFSGEWQVDETLNRLFSEGDYGAIVIGIENGGESRINEYTPWNNPKYGGGEGDLYMKFMVETLKPYVDKNYRTRPGKEYNALIGSSLGALISNYGGVKYSDTFSKIGSFSPAYWIVASEFNSFITNSTADLSGSRIYFVAGSKESETMASDIESVKNKMFTKGLTAANTLIKLDAEGQHNENYWKREFGAAYEWLFKTTVLKTTDVVKKKLVVGFEKNQIFVKGLTGKSEARVYDMSGRLLQKLQLNNGWNTFKNSLQKGNYILQTETESIRFIYK
ncbi:alpha/beta hydrolase-fold protein [Kaistella polysaccharea]|uniref:alpha/beta hydrolase-fold protein n=1 Tax=Kaistella polysaccharea TaxID=2878534 RepID=UPI001CF39F42|nr:alpha/beta hydrolase-fold protein [Kaistella polysaccharea]